ncbi:MAG TPA: acetamidase/formamidase family protein [Beijerinckiaceae bacterium]|jgi:acetamidase/formamidase|nr:acetamidase/formamidase family protein [Beijerinckiaceae bacterium]
MAEHHVKAGPSTCQWGYLDPLSKPVATIKSGDRITIDTMSGNKAHLPPADRFFIPPELTAIHAEVTQGPGPHILTGPVYVEGAKPGSVLEVKIEAVNLMQDWGINMIRPLAGTLPYDFEETRATVIPLDHKKMVGVMPWGLELALNPFFGIMSVAPPLNWGKVTSIIPRAFGGNLDNKELVAGTTLYLPIFVEGALFTCGDGHGAQGDGEVNVTAIETSLQGTFTLTVRDDLKFTYPRAETPTHYITMGMDPDLDQCAVMALRDMIVLLGEKANLSREDAYMLCSLACDLRVTQTVNGSKGIHAMIAKTIVHPTLTQVA